MGLNRASVRLSDVFVMAPALTEAKQSDNFSSDTHSRPAALDANRSDTDCRTLLKGCLMCLDKKSMMTKSHNGHEIKNEEFENLNTLAFASEIVKVNNSQYINKNVYDLSHKGSNMSNWIPSMDEKYTMGLQKTGNICLLKDKSLSGVNDMDGIIQNLSTDLNSGDLSQEFMQALSNIDPGVPQNSEPGTMSPGNDLPGGISNFYRDLLNDVDVLSMTEQIDENVVSSNEMKTQADLLDIEKEQRRLERRHDFLLRRLSKFQIRGIGRHLSSEVAGLLEHTHRALRQASQESKIEDRGTESVPTVSGTEESAVSSYQPVKIDNADHKGLSVSSMKNLVHRLEKARTVSSSALHRNKCNMRYFGSGSVEVSSAANSGISIPTLAQSPREELERTSGLLQAEISMMRHQVDSDATASSSGAESCDEMQNFNNPHQQYCSISKRASWKWGQDRAAIASRWIWLQWQISDLEYRIRQLNELQKQIRISKGPVILEEEVRDSTPSCSVNGHRLDAPGRSAETWINGTNISAVSVNSDSNNCSRTKQFVISVFRKRRLLATTELHITSKKCRPSTIRCNCSMGLAPCALCTGRSDPTFPKESGDLTTIYEQIAYLDPGFHSKISFPKNISHIFHFNAIIKMPEWQQKTIRNIHKQLKLTPLKLTDKKEPREQRPGIKRSEHYRKYRKLFRRRSANVLSTKLKGKHVKVRKPNRKANLLFSKLDHKQQLAEVAMAQLQALSADDPEKDGEDISASGGSKRPSPVSSPQPVGLDRFSARDYRRNRVDSYDIDNIVIPYSVAASTRVEKLPYKEILTPKWRVVEEEPSLNQFKNGLIRNAAEDSDVEDVNDDAVVARHEKCEIEEKRKFMSYIKFPLTGSRSRANRRTDSRTESSGANTPDPMSPHTSDMMDVINSPPITPSLQQTADDIPTVLNLPGSLRRRTASQSRWVKERETVTREDPRCTTPESIEVQPYDSRVFPLADEDYDKMLRAMPSGHPIISECGNKGDGVALPPLSPESDSSSNSILGDEDPNDPEWVGGEGGGRERTKR